MKLLVKWTAVAGVITLLPGLSGSSTEYILNQEVKMYLALSERSSPCSLTSGTLGDVKILRLNAVSYSLGLNLNSAKVLPFS